jgi:hypothetical protein
LITKAIYYKRYPDTFLSALSKIGGLLALFKIGIMLKINPSEKVPLRARSWKALIATIKT